MENALSHRLEQSRERLFVGRAAQLDEFARALQSPHWPRAVWHIHGLGGIGKTSLLRQWKQQAREAGAIVIALDGRDFEPNVGAFCQALRIVLTEKLQIEIEAPLSPPALCAAIAGAPSRVVLQIDTLELLAPLDYFLREKFVPLLPQNATLMLAGRDALSLAWRADAGLWNEVASFDLAALSPLESQNYLQKRGIEAPFQLQILGWTHGHPLALSLAADVWQQQAGTLEPDIGKSAPPAPDDLPHLIGPLLEHLMREVPTPAHRAALEACAIVRALTQELLAEMLQAPLGAPEQAAPDFQALFEWLRALSLVQSHRYGVFPHDIARELLVADLRFRTPDWHGELHRRARVHYLRRIRTARGAEQERATFDCIYLHRLSPVVAPYLRWSDSGLALELARTEDFSALLEMVAKHEGAASRDLAQKHFAAQPEGVIVVRGPDGSAQGFVFQLALERVSSEILAIDVGARRAQEWLKRDAPLRARETATLFRFWMDKDAYQSVGATQSLIFVQAVRHYITAPHLAFVFFPCADPDFWSDGFAYADLERISDADFAIEDREFGMFGHDWRARPVLSWLDLLSQREMQSVAPAPRAPILAAGEAFPILDETQFLAATQSALRSGGDGAALRRNPLLGTALVDRRARQLERDDAAKNAPPTPDERVLALRLLLRDALVELGAAPRGNKAHRALELSFGRRALTQEAAAAAMDVSHSSLRRYLSAGIAQVAQMLREREQAPEVGAAPSSDENQSAMLF